MFDPDGDQAAADSTRSSTSLDTGSSVNPRTARRLATASYTSMIAYLPPPRSQQSLYWHERRSALVLDQDHHEFRRLGRACVAVNEMNIVGAFIEGLSLGQCHRLATL